MKKLAVFDFETDPFLYGRKPEPFSVGFFDGKLYWDCWEPNTPRLTREEMARRLVRKFLTFLESLEEEYIIYAHNGGKFDFFYLLDQEAIENPIKMINSRIVKAKIGKHELRDSYAILPIPLAAYQKDEIDYQLFERGIRDDNKQDILYYLAKDCEYLFTLVKKFIDRFGLKLTIGGTAINQLKEIHPFDTQGEKHDSDFRKYYFGGRVQAYETGILKGKFKIFDVNSMYPYVMKNSYHPTGREYTSYYMDDNIPIDEKGFITGIELKGRQYINRPYFAIIAGFNRGAFPTRTKEGLNFNIPYGRFHVTSHELQVALKHGLFYIEKIIEIHIADKMISFGTFVDMFAKEKIEAKKAGDKAGYIFAKLISNAGYGKLGQNPERFTDTYIRYPNQPLPEDNEFELDEIHGRLEIWKKPAPRPSYFDVATAASITGAARAVLLDALAKATRPIYCDTDSIICEDLPGVKLDPYELGAWDCEATGDFLAVAGKKLYSLYSKGKPVKMASKGARLTPAELVEIAEGKAVEWKNQAPSFSISMPTRFIQRTIKMRK